MMTRTPETRDPEQVLANEWRNLTRRQRAMIRRWSPDMAAAADFMSATNSQPKRGFTWFTDTFAR